MSYRENYQTIVEKMRALWAAIFMNRILQTMTQFDPARLRKPEQNGNGNGVERGTDMAHLHGGAADGLPVAAPTDARQGRNGNGSQPHPVDGHGYAGSSNGAVPTEVRTRSEVEAEPEDSEELTLPAGSALVGLTSVLESLLFVAGEPVEVAHLAKSLDLHTSIVEKGLARLGEQYKKRSSGLRLQMHNGRYQLVTSPATARFVEDFLNVDFSSKLSSAALETLAIVAYRQPVTRIQIEAVRGVDCSGVLRSLTARGLIEEVGRLDAVGRPILYGVTDIFMQHFGLTALDDLPPLPEEDADILHAATALADEADAADRRHLEDDEPSEYNDFLAGKGPSEADTA